MAADVRARSAVVGGHGTEALSRVIAASAHEPMGCQPIRAPMTRWHGNGQATPLSHTCLRTFQLETGWNTSWELEEFSWNLQLTSALPQPVSESLPCAWGEAEHRPLTVLGVADQHAASLRLRADFDAPATVTAAVTGLPPRRVHIHQLLSGSGPARLRAGAPRI